MSRSMVFWDTRFLLMRLACRKNVGQATSRRSAGDASASTFRSVILLPPLLREKLTKRAVTRISRRYFVADTRGA